jgi:ADP-heptose:LPS heptosyltransferase
MKPPPPAPAPLVPARLLENPAKILFVMHPGIGDFCYLQNFFRELAARFPLLEMHLWVGEHRITTDRAKWDGLKNFILYDWLAACPYFKKIYKNNYSPADLAGAIPGARAEKYDAVVTLVLTRWHKYARLAREIHPAGIVISAMRPFDIKGWLRTFPYKKPDIVFPSAPSKAGHISDIFSWWFQRLFGCGLPVEKRMPFINIPGEWTRWADDFIRKIGADGKKRVFVNVTAKDWKRCWPLENGIETIKAMRQAPQWKDAIFLLNAMPGDVAIFQDVINKSGLERTHLFSAEENFFQLPAVLGKCSLIISVETSVMHLANAVRVSVIALMRKKYAHVWHPMDTKNTILVTTKKQGDRMDEIPPGRVLCAISGRLAATHEPKVPLKIRFLNWYKYRENWLKHSEKYRLTRDLVQFLKDANRPCIMSETGRNETAAYLGRTLAGTLNAPFVLNYRFRKTKITFDDMAGMFYAITDENHRLYFKRGLRRKTVGEWFNNLCMEQDVRSPHNYCFDDMTILGDTIIADAGAAEGNFTLKFIDKIKMAFLFETDPEWIEALEATFRPWKNKVVIVNKFVGDTNDRNCITLDEFFSSHQKPTLLKLDIEGAERKALGGADRLLRDGTVSDVLACAYHHKDDAGVLSGMLRSRNYATSFSPGCILAIRESGFSPDAPFDFRRGMLHGKRMP